MGSIPTTLQYTNGQAAYLMPARVLGYAGCMFTFLISMAAAFESGSIVLKKLEENFWAILEDFQTNEDYQVMMRDEEYGPLFYGFL